MPINQNLLQITKGAATTTSMLNHRDSLIHMPFGPERSECKQRAVNTRQLMAETSNCLSCCPCGPANLYSLLSSWRGTDSHVGAALTIPVH